ncbi:39 kDa protein/pp31 [Spodoptera litura nucleopolyhedrovirus II]|uniref:39 kDa protein/pp31 n=1 Tax=Spodoptera litura nucleopolyhedrovirus II TaxID=566270 RepID=UPI0001874619|nr:39 kDa protein/pp31 [Spodoptera litura nucleopolyhedrovirus II]ACI47493.1 39 kDa protein/pp31 [Spodoptera litura nucleopolyhedrovirus II]
MTTTAAATTTTNALTEIYNNFGGGNIVCDKTKMEHVTAIINTLEKKKIKYKILPMPMCGKDGLEITFAIVIIVDKNHNDKRNKKSISNNKYILFNSWYTKNRSASWPNSHTMWNLMKTQASAKPFVEIFDFMEKLGKFILLKNQTDVAANAPENTNNSSSGKNDVNQLCKLYDEFYKITTYTFTHNAAPSSSFIYDIKLNKTDLGGVDGGGLEKLNRQTLEEGVAVFKNILSKENPSIAATIKPSRKTIKIKELPENNKGVPNTVTTTTKPNSRKRTKPVKKAAVPAKKQQQQQQPPAITMEDDQTDDTQMSYS